MIFHPLVNPASFFRILLFFIVLFPIFGYLLGMVGFFIKKAFFDGWDNFLQLILQNFVYLGLLLAGLSLMYLTSESSALFFLSAAVIVLLMCISLGGTAESAKNWADYKSEVWRPYARGIKRNIRHSLFFFLILALIFMCIYITIPFYLSFENAVGYILPIVMVWLVIFLVLALPYYFPLMTMLPGDGPVKTLKKCFLVSFDNPGKSLLLVLHILFDTVVSVLTIGLLPGISGIMLSGADMTKLLMKKYDWLEENPGKTKKDINWDELLQEERENVGVRTLKGMIFPWK